jgi:hypothetical protein
MSDLVRKSVELPDVGGTQSNGKIAKSRRKERAAAPSVDATINIDIDDVNVDAETDMTDLAIAIADQSLKGATMAFNRRYEQNLLAFGRHVNAVTAQTSRDLIRQVKVELLDDEE